MITFDTLISADELAAAQKSGTPPLVLDCSFELTDPQAGQRAYEAGHIPGAVFIDVGSGNGSAVIARNVRVRVAGGGRGVDRDSERDSTERERVRDVEHRVPPASRQSPSPAPAARSRGAWR